MPAKGSQSEQRAFKAKIHLLKEVIGLCSTIDELGDTYEDETEIFKAMRFRNLFNIYQHICNKVTGLLVRAKKQGVVEYEGEALFQGKHDNVIIRLVKPMGEIRRELEQQIKKAEKDLDESVMYQIQNGPIYS